MNEFEARKVRRIDVRRGFTLLEVLLVLIILAVVAAAAVPALQRSLARRQVRAAVDKVETKLFRARIGAMRSSQVFAFQYMAGSGSYRFGPQDDPAAAPAANSSAKAVSFDDLGSDDDYSSEEGALPEGLHFLADNTPDEDASGDVVLCAAGDGWSDPIFFYPDGTTTNARFMVANDRGYALRLKLRGITGNVTVGEHNGAVE